MKDVDWAKLTDDLLESMVFTQSDLADRCLVTQQSISNWKNGLRSPGGFAREKLFDLLIEAEIDKTVYTIEGLDSLKRKPRKLHTQLPEDVANFAMRLSLYKKKKRSEAIAVADFLLNRN